MKRNILVSAVLIIVLLLLIFFKPSLGWKLRSLLAPAQFLYDEKSLVQENQTLKAELAQLKIIKSQLPDKPPSYLRAAIYSRYPMNFKNEFLVNAGLRDGVIAGRAVAFNRILIGKVEKVFEDTALVETIFDGRFQSSARIGERGFSALLQGGSLPKAILIPQKAEVKKGDIIYSVSPDFPYGLAVGEVAAIQVSADKLFLEATINFAYDINMVQTVLIAK